MSKRTLQRVIYCWLFVLMLAWPVAVSAQDEVPEPETPGTEEEQQVPTQVNVEPAAEDEQIAERLARILEATQWFVAPAVDVRDGVVFLDGQANTQEQREWAGNLARSTEDVVAVVNRIEVIPRSVWDFSPAWTELRSLWRNTIQAIPLLVFAAVVLWLSWWLTKLIIRFSRRFFSVRLGSSLLAAIAARIVAIPVFLLGVYLVLQVAGLTRLALTVLGGTGIVGIVVGFAFRDIAENFLASILLSIRQPFRRDDLIEVVGHVGIVQQLNTRTTVLITLEGNHVQIPNSIIFKNTVTNYTANANRRSDFVVSIGYDSAIIEAQQIIAQVLYDHPTVFRTPEPLVLVDELAASTVNLRIYFWYDATQYAPFKIKSSLLRLIMRALQDAHISMPDEAREVIFPQGVPIIQASAPEATPRELPKQEVGEAVDAAAPVEPVTSVAEGDLSTDEPEIRAQMQKARVLEDGEDLLKES
ncbi:MAG: mechanosensitive ion channel family protein [Litorilinea sp.]